MLQQDMYASKVQAKLPPKRLFLTLFGSDLHTTDGDCTDLTRKTAMILQDKDLQERFVLASRYDLETRLSIQDIP